MGDTEREFSEKLANIRSKSSKRAGEIADLFSKMARMKAESLKKTEEMMSSAVHDLEKFEQDLVKSKDLVPESKQRLSDELANVKSQMKQKYDELKNRISAAVIPT
jgi:exonuclease VII large subunit